MKDEKDDAEEGGGGWIQVRRGKNPRQGNNLDKTQKQNKQYNYEETKSTRHAGRPTDYWHINNLILNYWNN